MKTSLRGWWEVLGPATTSGCSVGASERLSEKVFLGLPVGLFPNSGEFGPIPWLDGISGSGLDFPCLVGWTLKFSIPIGKLPAWLSGSEAQAELRPPREWYGMVY